MGLKDKFVFDIPLKIKGHAWIPCGTRYEKSYELNSLALIGIEKAIAEKYGWDEILTIVRNTWKNLAKEGIKKIVKEFNIKGNGADAVMKIFSLLAILLGFKHKITKLSKDESVGIIYKCSHWDAMKAHGVEHIWNCKAIHMDFVNAAIEEINPNLEAVLETSMPDGDENCKMIIRLKRK